MKITLSTVIYVRHDMSSVDQLRYLCSDNKCTINLWGLNNIFPMIK